jgi:N-acetylglucosamine-6-phosphate deacetylase
MNFESRANTDVVIRYKNCYVLREGHLILDDIWVRKGRVIDPMELFFKERKMADITIECNRYIASPGFIDIQLNGGFKYDFSSFSNPNEAEKGLQFVSKELLEYGVTAYCPTLVSCSKEYYNMILPIMKKKKGGIDGAAILGVCSPLMKCSTL